MFDNYDKVLEESSVLPKQSYLCVLLAFCFVCAELLDFFEGKGNSANGISEILSLFVPSYQQQEEVIPSWKKRFLYFIVVGGMICLSFWHEIKFWT